MHRPSLIMLLLLAPLALGQFVPSDDRVTPERTSDVIQASIRAGRATDVVEQVAQALANERPRLVQADGRLVALNLWADELLVDPQTRQRIADVSEKSFGARARTELMSAIRERDVARVMTIAERYPWSHAASRAPVEAARLLVQSGDARGARDLLARVPSDQIDPDLRPALELPVDSQLAPAGFSAQWYLTMMPWTQMRVVPVSSAATIFIASPDAVAALNDKGRTLWTTAEPGEAAGAGNRPARPVSPGDRSLSQPAVWCDLSGVPRLVVARHTTSDASSLRAYRAASGELLWDSAETASAGKLLFMGGPAVAGRYVYAAAIEQDETAGPQIVLAAMELTSGRLFWKCVIGPTGTQPQQNRNAARDATDDRVAIGQHVAQSSCVVTTDAQCAYLAPGGGWLIAVDRFSGSTRWMASYAVEEHDKRAIERDYRAGRLRQRWRDRAVSDGRTVAIAPIDSKLVLAFGVATGKPLWQSDAASGADLVGLLADRVLLMGTKMRALDLRTGVLAWESQIDASTFTGPGFIEGPLLGAMTSAGPVFFTPADGKPVPRHEPEKIILDKLLRNRMTRAMLATADLLQCFEPEVEDAGDPRDKR